MTQIKEAILLAGGLGTRLRSAVPDLPKCLAPVGGRPFIGYLIDYFRQQGIERFIFALGYKSTYFDDFFRVCFPDGGYAVSLEDEPLGTGGAIRQACELAEEKTVLILNGDTFYRIGLGALSAFHEEKQADCSLCLKPMKDFDRFGVVELDGEQRVRGLREKQYYPAGLINGGVYALNRESLMRESWPPVFSFEKDYLERFVGGMESMRDGMEGAAGRVDRRVFGLVQDSYFIDMGIPEDYRRAQKELTDQQL
jgi:D-glycero-alpha-D-manno-heptose 1-phosphate guanylyltransferase